MVQQLHLEPEAAPRRGLPPGTGWAARALRVLFINDTSRNGGPGQTLVTILKFLDASRVHRTVILPHEGVVSERIAACNAAETILIEPDLIENLFQPLSREMKRADFEVAKIRKFLRAAGNIGRALRWLNRLAVRVRKERFDVVFCNGTTANFIGGYLAWAVGVPVVWHVLYSAIPAFQRPLHLKLASQERVRALICVSRATTPQFGRLSDKITVVPDAVNLDEFDRNMFTPALRRELGVDENTVIFGSFGRVLPRKGFVELINAARMTVDRLSAAERKRCRFVVIGDTPRDVEDDHLEECRTLVQQLGLSDLVCFIGFRPDIRPYASDFDVAVVPSIYEDPLPRAVMESMALAKPVVAFDRGGIGDMITDGVEGRLVDGAPPNIEAMAAACLTYFRDPVLRRRHGDAARARVEQSFEARAHARVIEQMLVRAAGGGWRPS